MDLAHLRYFKNLVECGSYTKAAAASFVAQSTLSLAIKSLERELGFFLVGKTGPGFALTEEGRVFYHAACAALAELDRAIAWCQPSSELENTVRIGIEDSSFNARIRRLLQETAAHAAPDASVSYRCAPRASLVHGVSQGALDIAFTFSAEPHDNLEFSKAIPCCLMACVVPESPFAACSELSTTDLTRSSLYTYHRTTPFGAVVAPWVERTMPRAFFDMENEDALASIVRTNKKAVGLTLAPRETAFDAAGLKFIPIKESKGAFYLYAMQKQGVARTHAAQRIKSELVLKNLGLA